MALKYVDILIVRVEIQEFNSYWCYVWLELCTVMQESKLRGGRFVQLCIQIYSVL